MTTGADGCDGPARVTEELRQLAELLIERLGPWTQRLREGTGPPGQDGQPPCARCPLCAVVGLLRGERPELAAALVEHGAGLLAVLREVSAPPGPGPESATAHPTRVQRVPVRRTGEGGGPGC